MENQFPTFIHITQHYQRRLKSITSQDKSTIPGLLFLQGEPREIQKSLSINFPGLYLSKDSATQRPARIDDHDMRLFMRYSGASDRDLRIMLKPVDTYADGRTLVRVVNGILDGVEGYVVRLNRDRYLVTQMGNMTVAISGIHKDSIVNVDEFAKEKRRLQSSDLKHLFVPQSDIDRLALRQLIDLKLQFLRDNPDAPASLAAELQSEITLLTPLL